MRENASAALIVYTCRACTICSCGMFLEWVRIDWCSRVRIWRHTSISRRRWRHFVKSLRL